VSSSRFSCLDCGLAIVPGSPVLFQRGGMVHLACSAAGPGSRRPGRLVLNVDDRPEVRYVRSRILRQADFTIREAAWGSEALKLAEAEPPALVLLDVRLPDIDGFEVCRRLTRQIRSRVLMISEVLTDDSSRAEGIRAGASGYLVEPVDPPTLVRAVTRLVEAAS
jgi:CheY-like chemotaxis protein